MKMAKLKKLLSCVLAVLVAMLGLTCTALAVTAEEILSNGGLEDASPNQSGFTEYIVPKGQSVPLLNNWYGFNWWGGDSVDNAIRLSQVTDSHSGTYALREDIPTNSCGVEFHPQSMGTLESGYYTLSFWVKTNNGNGTVEIKLTDDTIIRRSIPVCESWRQLRIENIYLSDTVGIADVWYGGKHIIISISGEIGDGAKATYAYIDDIAFEKTGFVSPDNGSFENPGSNTIGFTDYIVPKGQNVQLFDNWYGFNWWGGDSIDNAIRVSQSADGYSGYCVYQSIPTNSCGVELHPQSIGTLAAGYYSLSFWVKTNNGSGMVDISMTDGATYSKGIPAGESWHKVTVQSIHLTGTNDFADLYGGKHIRISISGEVGEGAKATYAYIDDVRLENTGLVAIENGSLENPGSLTFGYDEYIIPKGQNVPLFDNWYGFNWWGADNIDNAIRLSQVADGHTDYALYERIPTYSCGVDLHPAIVAVDAGTYNLTFWVKTNNATGIVSVKMQNGTLYEMPIPAGESWHQVKLCGITVTDDNGFADLYGGKHINISISGEVGEGAKETYAYIDDIALVKKTAGAAAAAPVIVSHTQDSVTLEAIENGEYAVNGSEWQSSPVFAGLDTGVSYSFTQRYAVTDDCLAGAISEAVSFKITANGDADGNGKIESSDLVVLKKYLLNTETQYDLEGCDANGDGSVDIRDFVNLKKKLA